MVPAKGQEDVDPNRGTRERERKREKEELTEAMAGGEEEGEGEDGSEWDLNGIWNGKKI